jgi:hypothetical protein
MRYRVESDDFEIECAILEDAFNALIAQGVLPCIVDTEFKVNRYVQLVPTADAQTVSE